MENAVRFSVRLAFLCAALALALLASPAHACGCGGYVPRDGDAHVTQERALLRWENETEDIVMAFNVQGGSDEAALIMPVPARAEVKLADPKLFATLETLTAPHVERRPRPPSLGAGAGAPPLTGAPPVTLLERQTLGPFDVSTLAATDSRALADWLKNNGYAIKPQLASALQPYVDQGWYYVAVRLSPGQKGDQLKGSLDPIWVSFPAHELVYPMRASAAASVPLPVILYVLAPHRVSKPMSFGSSHISFADWVQPGGPGVAAPLAPFVAHRLFLTKFEEMAYPDQINADYIFAFAGDDQSYHDTRVEYYDDPNTGLIVLLVALACLLALLGVPLFILGVFVFFLLRRRRRAVAAPG